MLKFNYCVLFYFCLLQLITHSSEFDSETDLKENILFNFDVESSTTAKNTRSKSLSPEKKQKHSSSGLSRFSLFSKTTRSDKYVLLDEEEEFPDVSVSPSTEDGKKFKKRNLGLNVYEYIPTKKENKKFNFLKLKSSSKENFIFLSEDIVQILGFNQGENFVELILKNDGNLVFKSNLPIKFFEQTYDGLASRESFFETSVKYIFPTSWRECFIFLEGTITTKLIITVEEKNIEIIFYKNYSPQKSKFSIENTYSPNFTFSLENGPVFSSFGEKKDFYVRKWKNENLIKNSHVMHENNAVQMVDELQKFCKFKY